MSRKKAIATYREQGGANMGGSNNVSNNFSKFDRMSTETLNDILTQGFLLSDDEVYSIDEIVYIAELVANRQKENPEYQGINAHESWSIFTKHYMPTTSDAKSLYDDSDKDAKIDLVLSKNAQKASSTDSKKHIRHHSLVRVGLIAAVLAALLLAFTVTSYALGYNPWKYVATWTDETFGFSKNNSETAELQNEFDNHHIADFRAPTYLPEGFVQTDIESSDMGNHCYVFSYYSNGSSNDIIISFIQYFDNTHVNIYQKDDVEPEIVVNNKTTYYIMTNLGHNVIVWQHENCEYSVSSDICKEELFKIVNSMEV